MLLGPSVTFLVGLLLGEVVDSPGEDDDLLSDIVDVVLGTDIVTAHGKRTCKSISYNGISGTSDMDGTGWICGGVLHIHPNTFLRPGPIFVIRIEDALDGTFDESLLIHLEVEVSVHSGYGSDHADGYDLRCDLLRYHRRCLPKDLGHLEAWDREIGGIVRRDFGLE